MATIHDHSGFFFVADVTPRWWSAWNHRDPHLAVVIQTVLVNAPWCCAISYDTTGKFEAKLLVPADVTMATLMQKREALLDKLDELEPKP